MLEFGLNSPDKPVKSRPQSGLPAPAFIQAHRLLTNLPRVPLVLAISTSTLLMICMSGRMVPAMAMMTGSIEARYRGGFMSINSSVQQFSCGLAAYASGHIIGQSATGELTRFPWVGLISVTCILLCIYLSRFLKVPAGVKAKASEATLAVEYEC